MKRNKHEGLRSRRNGIRGGAEHAIQAALQEGRTLEAVMTGGAMTRGAGNLKAALHAATSNVLRQGEGIPFSPQFRADFKMDISPTPDSPQPVNNTNEVVNLHVAETPTIVD